MATVIKKKFYLNTDLNLILFAALFINFILCHIVFQLSIYILLHKYFSVRHYEMIYLKCDYYVFHSFKGLGISLSLFTRWNNLILR